ncbi:MAG: nucleotidyl transferase AbiEii/AbiGii toxin family protein [Deltaproteobacteria bacterium]|nr:nucleotidyl transferase AbiEii/AbiGii toxin family protein [Deltaproteobacteria bacterium]MDQ3297936.1 nucleotidyl transferase AbiEii/AbiGii toxin family protein [Myxococcota bacterium]
MTSDPITPGQRSALAKLAPVVADVFYLAGGVAIAARLRHRQSRDLDLFSETDPIDRQASLEQLVGLVVLSRSRGTLHLKLDDVPVTLLQYPYRVLRAPETVADLPISLASVDDLVCMKLSAVAGRGLARDFWDLHELVAADGRPLAMFLDAFRQKYPVEDLGHVVRSLAYFGDAEAQPLPEGLALDHWKRIRASFEAWVGQYVGA